MLYILTLNYNGADKLEKLHPSLISSLIGIDYHWLIRDHGSNDRSLETIRSWKNDRITAINYKHNRENFAQGCNFLYREAASKSDDLILLLNNDIIFQDTTSLQQMKDLLDRDRNVGIVGAKLCYPGTNILQHAGVIFSPRTNNLPYHYRVGEKSDHTATLNREFQAITGAVMMLRPSYCQFNPAYQWCFDDIDLCLTVKYEMKKKIVYCGQTNITHEESASLKKNPINKLFMGSNVNYFLKKWNSRYIVDHDLYLRDANYNLYR